VTATGPCPQSIIKSSIGIGALLVQGIGDTIRVSLTGSPLEEIKLGYEILQSLDLFKEKPILISCPTCGRCQMDLESIVQEVQLGIEKVKIPLIIAIMGCEVNGPGEAKQADIGVACTRKGGILFRKGKIVGKVEEQDIVKVLLEEVEKLSCESENQVKH
jgi:(E)-4-hydroxy-3-methylbut-2-enyl-diphosphate synthase